jgi:predicted nucleotidyltransferase
VATGDASAGSDLDLMVTFVPGIAPGLEFFAMQDELEHILGCRVDLLTRRSVERSDNPIRRRSILASAREIFRIGRSPTCSIFCAPLKRSKATSRVIAVRTSSKI